MTLPLTVAATLLAGCLLDWDGPRPAALPADRGVETRAGDAAPADQVAEHTAWDDAYPEDQPRRDVMPDAARDTTAAPDVADAAAADLMPPDAALKPDLKPVCAYKLVNASQTAPFNAALSAALAAGINYHAAWLNNGSTFAFVHGATVTDAENEVNKQTALGFSVVKLISNYTHSVWLTQGGKYILYESSLTDLAQVAAGLNGLVAAGASAHTFAHGYGPYTAWLKSGATYKVLTGSFKAIVPSVNTAVAGGWQVTALLAKSEHTVWLKNGLCP